VATLALIVALGDTAFAAPLARLARLVSGDTIVAKHSLSGNRMRDHTLTGDQINLSKLGTVPTANHADSAGFATTAGSAGSAPPSGAAGGALAGSYPNPSLAAPEAWHLVGQTVGEPQFGPNWMNDDASLFPVRFYKDQLGIVHLGGTASSNPGSGVIFTLPVGYRPQYLLTMAGEGCGTGAVFVATDGTVEAGSAGMVCNLDGLSFRAGP
jgi:hypothetical protein